MSESTLSWLPSSRLELKRRDGLGGCPPGERGASRPSRTPPGANDPEGGVRPDGDPRPRIRPGVLHFPALNYLGVGLQDPSARMRARFLCSGARHPQVADPLSMRAGHGARLPSPLASAADLDPWPTCVACLTRGPAHDGSIRPTCETCYQSLGLASWSRTSDSDKQRRKKKLSIGSVERDQPVSPSFAQSLQRDPRGSLCV